MSTQSKHTVEVSCAVRRITDKAIAVVDGTTERVLDDKTGKMRDREVWYFLPKSLITVEPDDYAIGDGVNVTMPEFLAIDKGLI